MQKTATELWIEDLTSRAREYSLMCQQFLTKAQEALAQDDLLQASKKGWGAAALAVKSVAQRRGWQHGGQRELFRVVNRLVQETGDEEIRNLFDFANSLHINFYENWMPGEWVENRVGRMEEFRQKLAELP